MDLVDIEQQSFREISRLSSAESIQFGATNGERRWRLSYLKNQFKTLELQKLFNRYIQRISHGYFSQFLSLQIMLVTAHLITLLAVVEHLEQILPDIILYGLVSVFSVILLVITDNFVKTHPHLLKKLAATAFVIIFFINAFIPFYYNRNNSNLRPAYTAYLIISNYIFLNVHNDLVAFVLGLFVSIFHLATLILVTYEDKSRLFERLGSDAIYLVCINGLGMYFRYMNEIVIRRSFLDRRSCIESTHQLTFEEEQENSLMSSIIPQHIIAKVRSTLTEYIHHDERTSSGPKQKPFEDLYVDEHPNVTILFADIVNYTAMTTKLKSRITDLLDILNEMFGRFDDASEKLQVLRIKFLGDCYYCVAGLPPNPAPNHAEACVDLGLEMISIIADIRKRKNLDINMRIGIHTGKISSGIIGYIKWQYDVWSKDVDTANKMETEGCPGMVHITKETKARLKKSYDISVSNKIVNGERTYLIQPPKATKTEKVPNGITESKVANHNENQENNDNPQRRPTIYIKRSSTAPNDLKNGMANGRSYSLISNYQTTKEHVAVDDDKETANGKRHTFPNSNEPRHSNAGLGTFQRRPSGGSTRISTERRLTGNERKRRTAFMNNNLKRYTERLDETNKELKDTIEKMLLSKFEQWFKVHDMYRLLLVFKDFKTELDFFRMPDPLFKYYLLCEILLLILVFIIENLTLAKWDWPAWPFFVTLGVILFILLPLTWTHFVWTKYRAKSETDIPTNKIIKFFYNSSIYITNNSFIRLVIYTVMYVLFCSCVLTEWLDCYDVATSGKRLDNVFKRNFLSLAIGSRNDFLPKTDTQCTIPWHMTETCGLAIIMSFLYLRMYMWLKLFYASIIVVIYSYCILEFSGDFYGDSQTYNILVDPQISHIMSVFFLTLILHLVDRQTEYMHRIDHLWYRSLIEKEKQAAELHSVNNVLLRNILPLHVAEQYLNVNRNYSEEVYYEPYPEVAIMFASITNFSVEDMGQAFLKNMGAIISDFDLLSVGSSFGRPIEKIKIAKWTYMAACGLNPGLGDAENIRRDSKDHVVISLLKFAVSLMQKLKGLNRETGQSMKLRIGISHGPVAAGVVGFKKPLYDVWGDPVNMASRMDTTGQADQIQVLRSTADIIERFGYACFYRGDIKVKGRDNLVSTYFVGLNDDFNLIPSLS